ncbi:MAG: hypothetical protein ACREA9_13580 [Pyrinomonadaceae bacterium]
MFEPIYWPHSVIGTSRQDVQGKEAASGHYDPELKHQMVLPVLKQLQVRLTMLSSVFTDHDRSVFWIIVMSAVLLTAARAIAPFEVQHDQAKQLETAQRFAHGLGLTTTDATSPASNDVLLAPPPKYLTDWPPGLSLLVAAFLYIGINLLWTLKVIYVATTLIGWVGWGIIASQLVARPSVRAKAYSWIHLIICALLPFVFTPWWAGTDIFLWAGVPFVVISLVRVGRNQLSVSSIAFAGVLCGAMYAMRYLGLSLGLAGALILFQVSYPRLKIFFKRLGVFLLAALTVILPVTIFLMVHAQRVKVAALAPNVVREQHSVWKPLKYTLKDLPVTSNLLLGHPLLEIFVYQMKISGLIYLTGIISLMVLLLVPILLWRGPPSEGLKARNDMALSLSFLPISFVIFLIGVGIATYPYYLGVRRYHEPVAMCGILVFYEIATRRLMHVIVRRVSQAIVLMFILYVGAVLPALALTDRRYSLAIGALGFNPSRMTYRSTSQDINYPSWILYTRKESSRTAVKRLNRENPQALFYAKEYGLFVYDELAGGPVPGKSFRPFPDVQFWNSAYAAQPVRIFWVINEDASLDFIPASNKRLVFSDSFERTKILASDFPAGRLIPDAQVTIDQRAILDPK